MGKYYAVVVGRNVGIYNNWTETETQIKGYPGAIFKSFSSRKAAEEFIQRSTNKSTNISADIGTMIFTDGSYSNNECGFGIVIMNNGNKFTAYGKVPLYATNNVAELYAVYVALSLVKGPATIFTDSNYVIACLTSYIYEWKMNGWKGVSNRNILEGIFVLLQDRTVNFKHVASHSGIELNEEADELANIGRKCSCALIVFKNGETVVKQDLEKVDS